MRAKSRSAWLSLASYIAALALSAFPLPAPWSGWWPAWVPLLAMYWCLTLPGRTGMVGAWLSGLALDVLTGALLGQHALALALVAYLTLRSHRQVRVFHAGQQAILVGLCLLLYLAVIFSVRYLTGTPPWHWSFWTPALSGMICWPLLLVVMRAVRTRCNVG